MTPDALTQSAALPDQITAYLSGGGLFNPKLANHEAVRDLLIECRDALQQAHAELDVLRAQVSWLTKAADKLLAHCPDAECGACAKAMCPFGDGFHFHHDGCPSCSAVVDGRKEGAQHDPA